MERRCKTPRQRTAGWPATWRSMNASGSTRPSAGAHREGARRAAPLTDLVRHHTERHGRFCSPGSTGWRTTCNRAALTAQDHSSLDSTPGLAANSLVRRRGAWEAKNGRGVVQPAGEAGADQQGPSGTGRPGVVVANPGLTRPIQMALQPGRNWPWLAVVAGASSGRHDAGSSLVEPDSVESLAGWLASECQEALADANPARSTTAQSPADGRGEQSWLIRPQSLRSTRSFWLMKKRATEMGITTITAPYTRLLRKLERDGVMDRWASVGADPSQRSPLPTIAVPSLRAL